MNDNTIYICPICGKDGDETEVLATSDKCPKCGAEFEPLMGIDSEKEESKIEVKETKIEVKETKVEVKEAKVEAKIEIKEETKKNKEVNTVTEEIKEGKKGKNSEKVLECLKEGVNTQKGICDKLGIQSPTVNQILRKLIEQKTVTRKKDETSKVFTYDLIK